MVLLEATLDISSVIGHSNNKNNKSPQITHTEKYDSSVLVIKKGEDKGHHEGIDHHLILEAFRFQRDSSEVDINPNHRNVPPAVPCSYPELDLLLQGSGIHIKSLVLQDQKSQEYLDLMEHLRREDEEKRYYEMIPRPSFQDPIQASVSEVSSQIAAIFNVLFSSIFTGLAVWFATGMSNSLVSLLPLRVALAISACILVAVAEVVLYASYLEKASAAATKEKKTLEVKHIKRTWELNSDDDGSRNGNGGSGRDQGGGKGQTVVSHWRELAVAS